MRLISVKYSTCTIQNRLLIFLSICYTNEKFKTESYELNQTSLKKIKYHKILSKYISVTNVRILLKEEVRKSFIFFFLFKILYLFRYYRFIILTRGNLWWPSTQWKSFLSLMLLNLKLLSNTRFASLECVCPFSL